MNPILFVLAIGVLGGIAVGLQGPLAGALSQRVGGAAASLAIHVSGALCSLLLVFVHRGSLAQGWRLVPWYLWGVGALGVVLYLTLAVTFPRLGSTMALTCIVVGQLLAGLALDHFGLLGPARPLDLGRCAGVALLLSGAYLIYR